MQRTEKRWSPWKVRERAGPHMGRGQGAIIANAAARTGQPRASEKKSLCALWGEGNVAARRLPRTGSDFSQRPWTRTMQRRERRKVKMRTSQQASCMLQKIAGLVNREWGDGEQRKLAESVKNRQQEQCQKTWSGGGGE